MSVTRHTGTSAAAELLADFSLEITGKDASSLPAARAGIPAGTRINVTFLGNEDGLLRREAARTTRALGLVAVPHVAARRIASRADLDDFLGGLRSDGNADSVFVVAGDPKSPMGPFGDALAVIDSGALQEHGVRHVGISGYPEGHPVIPDTALWAALEEKAHALSAAGLEGSIITQFGFDAAVVLDWVEQVRARGIDLPVRVGIPGPAGVKRLLGYASRFGVGTSTGIIRKYGISLTNLTGSAGPDRFMRSLADGYRVDRHGRMKTHFYTFGGLTATTEWVERFRAVS